MLTLSHTMMIQPDTLQFSAIRVLIDNLPSYMPLLQERKGYLGAGANDILRVAGVDNNKHQADFIMDLFTFRFIDHTTNLTFPPSKYIPTAEHLETHLFHHGHRITEISLAICICHQTKMDEVNSLLRVIGSSAKVLRCLTLPKCLNNRCTITNRGADFIIKSKLPETLQEITFLSTVFLDEDVLLNLLSSLINLKVLNISHISVLGCSPFPIPFSHVPPQRTLTQLEHLRIYDYVGCPCGCSPNFTREWKELAEEYTNLKTLQISNEWDADTNWLFDLRDGLRTRKEPLEYLSVLVSTYYYSPSPSSSSSDDGYDDDRMAIHRRIPSIIQELNADKINTGQTLEELYELLHGARVDATIKHLIIRVRYIWLATDKTHKTYSDMLAIIKFLIPRYRHLCTVVQLCVETLLIMVENSTLRQTLNLIPSFIETFITRIMMNRNYPLYPPYVYDIITKILNVYGDSISVDVIKRYNNESLTFPPTYF